MGKEHSKNTLHQNITLSLSKDLISELHLFLPKRGISRFVEEAIKERLVSTKSFLEQQYREAAQDQSRNREFEKWERFSGDGLNEQNDW